jgi:hypothetical protein
LNHLKNLAEAEIAAQHCFLWMRCPAYRLTSSKHVGFGQRDPLCDRRRVTIDCLPRCDLML